MNYPMVSDIRDNLSILGEIDCVSCSNPVITVHECKYKVDGITKYIDNQEFNFDNTFSHLESNEELYFYSIRPIIDLVFNQGIVTVFAYG
jgi:kinesin family protein 2/24